MDPTPAVLERFFHPVLSARALKKKPVRVEVAGQACVLFRDAQGRPAALADACPHRLAPLSSGRVRPDGRLQCPYHGWSFDARGHGQSPSQPELKRCDVRAYQVVERLGYLWLAGADVPLSALPDFVPEDMAFNGAFSMLFQAPLHVAFDNFSEDEHTPWVHTRLGWGESQVRTVRFEAENHEDRTEVHYRAEQRPSPLMPLLLVRRGDLFHNDWVMRFNPVRGDYTIHWASPTGQRRPFVTRITIFFVPETARTTRLHVFSFVQLLHPLLRPLLPLIRRAALVMSWYEVRDDARFIPTVADTPYSLKGMRLGRYDKPLIHQRKLLERIYYAQPAPARHSEPHRRQGTG